MFRMRNVFGLLCLLGACKTPAEYREQADEAAARILEEKQQEAFGRTEPFTIERPADTLRRRLLLGQDLPHAGPESLGTDRLEPIEHWPEEDYPPRDQPVAPWEGEGAFALSLVDALKIGARNSRDYQATKENVFLSALDLDLERDGFRRTYTGTADGLAQADETAPGAHDGVAVGADASVSKLLQNGALLLGSIGVDLVRLLMGGQDSALGVFADGSITLPLLRGAGRHIVTEPLKQAERNVVYELQTFERFKRTFAVRVATGYLEVLQQADQVANAEENYRGLVVLTRRTRALERAGRLPGFQVDQALQDELRARDRWIATLQSLESRLDRFKETLGLPPDAFVALERDELVRITDRARELIEGGMARAGAREGEIPPADAPVELVAPSREGGGPLELEETEAITVALDRRLDLRTAKGQIFDAQRDVVVAADALRAGLDLTGAASLGETRSLASAGSGNGKLEPLEGLYTLDLVLDLPWERTAERNAYRESYVALEQGVREVQRLEDSIKIDVRDALRNLLQRREGVSIQAQAVQLARARVTSTDILLDAGRAEVRDLLEAREALLGARNALTEAVIRYRIAELELQRDLGVLEVNEEGLWTEYRPDETE